MFIRNFSKLTRNFYFVKTKNFCFSSRYLSTSEVHPSAKLNNSKNANEEFMAVFPELVTFLSDKTKEYNAKDESKLFQKVLHYNVPHGKKNRGLSTVATYKKLVPPDQLTEQNLKLANILGWCVEILQGSLIMLDDIMDGSQTRRGQPCWYKLEDVGLTAINDAFFMEHGLFLILKNYFSDQECYPRLMELFQEVLFVTIVGQNLDVNSSKMPISDLTMDKYRAIAINKTAYYSFCLPVALAMSLAGYKNPEDFRQVKDILTDIGLFFQIQDDFLDCFGNPEITGKIGTDIQENKCTWLAAIALQRVNVDQKAILLECYGSSDLEKVKRVKNLYRKLDIQMVFKDYEEESYNMLRKKIDQLTNTVPQAVFLQMLSKIYQRDF